MAVNPMLSAGGNAIQNGVKSMDSVAQEIAQQSLASQPSESAGDGEPHRGFSIDEISAAVVDLKLYERQVQAATQVVKTADEVLGFLIDVHA
jgi:hypothetical protein